jgi:acetylornithine deacetylase/succinyl-diaminopimelate desuccinylase-like protein
VFAALAPLYNEHWSRIFGDLDQHVLPAGPSVRLLPGMEAQFLDSVQVNELSVLEDGRARARIDVRLLPDSDAAEWIERLNEALGPSVETSILLAAPPAPPSPWKGPWVEVLRDVLGDEGPVVPQVSAGITDSRYFRQRGVAAYGFSPFVLDPEAMQGIHARDERIPLDELERGAQRMTELVDAWARSEPRGTQQ